MEAPIPVYFIPGNHDNYDFLESVGAHGANEMKEVWNNVWHVPRVHVWEWDNTKFAACGGAYSVDQDHRTEYLSYWRQETISYGDIDNAYDRSQKVDVMFTHDVPFGVPYMEELLAMMKGTIPSRHETSSIANRECLLEIVEQFCPEVLIHGHMHHYYEDALTIGIDDEIGQIVNVVGLNCDETYDSMVMLDTTDLSVELIDKEVIVESLFEVTH
jgi:hypothetical protein